MKKWTYIGLLDSISRDWQLSGNDTPEFMSNLAGTVGFDYRFGDAHEVGLLIKRCCRIAYECGRRDEAEIAHEAIGATR